MASMGSLPGCFSQSPEEVLFPAPFPRITVTTSRGLPLDARPLISPSGSQSTLKVAHKWCCTLCMTFHYADHLAREQAVEHSLLLQLDGSWGTYPWDDCSAVNIGVVLNIEEGAVSGSLDLADVLNTQENILLILHGCLLVKEKSPQSECFLGDHLQCNDCYHTLLSFYTPQVKISHAGWDLAKNKTKTPAYCTVTDKQRIKDVWDVIKSHSIIFWCHMISVTSFCAIQIPVLFHVSGTLVM